MWALKSIAAACLVAGAAAQSLLAVLQPLSAFPNFNAPSVNGLVRVASTADGVSISANFSGLIGQTDYRFLIAQHFVGNLSTDSFVMPSMLVGTNDTFDNNACASKNQVPFTAKTTDVGNFNYSTTLPWGFFADATQPDRSGFFAHIAGRPVALFASGATCDGNNKAPSSSYIAYGVLGYETGSAFPTADGSDAAKIAKFFPNSVATTTGAGRAYMYPSLTDACRQQISGVVTFGADGPNVVVNLRLRGLIRPQHAIHVHNFGDLSDWNAMKTGLHFNPTNAQHACPADFNATGSIGHVGDLGNFNSSAGALDTSISTPLMKLDSTSLSNVFGHAVVVHSGADDCLRGSAVTYTGSAGSRYSYGVIARVLNNEAVAVPTLTPLNAARADAPPCRVVLSAVFQGTPAYAGVSGTIELSGSATAAANGSNAISATIRGNNLPKGAVVVARIMTEANLLSFDLGGELLLGNETAGSNACGAVKVVSTSQTSIGGTTITNDDGSFTQTVAFSIPSLFNADLSVAGNLDSILVSLAGRPIVLRSSECMTMADGSKAFAIYAVGVLGFSSVTGPVPRTSALDAAALGVATAPKFAVAFMFPTFTNNATQKTSGFIVFEKTDTGVTATPYLTGNVLSDTTNGIHVHENGDISDSTAMLTRVHFNPLNVSHACPGSFNASLGHVGDLGNFNFTNGTLNWNPALTVQTASNPFMTFGVRDVTNILGRAAVVHALNDKCGQGTNTAYTGDAGARFSYGVVGLVSSVNASALRSFASMRLDARGAVFNFLNNAARAVGVPAASASPSASASVTPSASPSPTPSLSLGASPSISASPSASESAKPIKSNDATAIGVNKYLFVVAAVIAPVLLM